MVAHIGRFVDGDAVGAAKVKDGELTIRLIFDLCVIARDTFVFNDDIIAELAAYINDWFFDLVGLLARLW